MKKDALIKFIDKYTLGDSIRMVNWKVDATNKLLRTRGELDGKQFIADVTLKEFTDITEDVRISIANTEKVRAMLSPFGEDIQLSINKNSVRVQGFTISDNDCESYCTAAEPSAIPPVTKNLDDTHSYEIEMDLTDEFIAKFLKARTALSDIEDFTLRMNRSKKLEFVFGYSIANSNRISILAPTVPGKDTYDGSPIKFPIKNLVEIFKANKEMIDGKIYFNIRGALKLMFSSDTFNCLYYQFASLKK